MTVLRAIRERLAVTQQVLAEGMGCTQGNVSFYERGQVIPPEAAGKLIEFARSRGLALNFDHIYGASKLPSLEEEQGA